LNIQLLLDMTNAPAKKDVKGERKTHRPAPWQSYIRWTISVE
jgi:hypothetical protein